MKIKLLKTYIYKLQYKHKLMSSFVQILYKYHICNNYIIDEIILLKILIQKKKTFIK